jgi:lysophospholipase L1-like esterase
VRLKALRLLTVLVTTVIGLGAAELVARRTYGEGFNILIDPYEDHSYRPFLEYEQVWGDRTIRFYTNSLGWKDGRPDRVIAKRPDRERIVVLGDSFAEGLGYVQSETLSGVAERELNAAGRRCEVLNGGRASYSPLLEYQRLKKFLAAGYHADTVVLLYDVSDAEDELYYASRYQFSAAGEPERFRGWNYHPALRSLYNHSALVRRIRRMTLDPGTVTHPGPQDALDHRVPPDFAPGAPPISARRLVELSPWAYGVLRANWTAHPASLAGWAEDGLRASFGNLQRIQRLTREHGVRLMMVIYPIPQMLYTREDPAYYAVLKRTFPKWLADRETIYGTRPGPLVTEYERRVTDFCRRQGIELLDLIPELQGVPEWHRLYIPGDIHFNDLGHRLAGRRIAEALMGKPGA